MVVSRAKRVGSGSRPTKGTTLDCYCSSMVFVPGHGIQPYCDTLWAAMLPTMLYHSLRKVKLILNTILVRIYEETFNLNI